MSSVLIADETCLQVHYNGHAFTSFPSLLVTFYVPKLLMGLIFISQLCIWDLMLYFLHLVVVCTSRGQNRHLKLIVDWTRCMISFISFLQLINLVFQPPFQHLILFPCNLKVPLLTFFGRIMSYKFQTTIMHVLSTR